MEFKSTSQEFLEAAYKQLNFYGGTLVNSTINPSEVSASEWVEKGDWLSLSYRLGADSIFFVNNDPVIIFFKLDEYNEKRLWEIFINSWSMARPQCLFIALPGEIRVYGLNRNPVRESEWSNISPLAVAKKVANVAEKLRNYNRAQIETGQAFAEERFGKLDNRADKRLIEDLKNLRTALIANGLDASYTHSLIGRSIFIRYLEDRVVLNQKYFDDIAQGHINWQKILVSQLEKPNFPKESSNRFYYNVLNNKAFTYALFRKLANDFNGNLFSTDIDEEEKFVTASHLQLLRSFLLGDIKLEQQSLFFWAYDFNIVPIELISSIYEEFYHFGRIVDQKIKKSKPNKAKDHKGTHYTPSTLVEFILSNLLTNEVLSTNPVILDPACGSGIFLVEAFRRIVRYNVKQQKRALTSYELREIIRTQIRGVEIDRDAIHIAAFSLYLALMHYQEPPAIQANPLLPKLIFEDSASEDDYTFSVLHHRNIFDLTYEEQIYIDEKLQLEKQFKNRKKYQTLRDSAKVLPISLNSCDIIVGNPPWGFIDKNAPNDITQAQNQAVLWCQVFDWAIGDKELSQAFIARTIQLLKHEGQAGLLVSSGILFKHHPNSINFRFRWLNETKIDKVVNFAHVRHLYFSAVSPFLFVKFQLTKSQINHKVQYWTAKRTRKVGNTQSVVLESGDLHRIPQISLKNDYQLWKVYWWGGHNDAALIGVLKSERNLLDLQKEREWPKQGQGFIISKSPTSPANWLREYLELPIDYFKRYGAIPSEYFEPVPHFVHRYGNRQIYDGLRILVKRGISQANGLDGYIEARLENKSYSVRNSIHGIPITNTEDWEAMTLIAILWSSLARYFFFMTASTWGSWHHELHLEEVMNLPIRFPQDIALRKSIVAIVEELQNISTATDIFGENNQEKIQKLENELDEIIFDLFELSSFEKELIQDMCKYGLEFLYRYNYANATLPVNHKHNEGLDPYLSTFLKIWNYELAPDGEFEWKVLMPSHIPMIAVVFTTKDKRYVTESIAQTFSDDKEWYDVLRTLDSNLPQEISRNIYIDGIVRVVTETNIIIIKRNEMRLWTRSKAREDAQATLLQAMRLQQITRGNGE